jgi:hypothetical protein
MNITGVHINITLAEILYSVSQKYQQKYYTACPNKYQQKHYIACPNNTNRNII